MSRYFEEVLIVGGDAPIDAPGRRVPDPSGPACALRGVVGALESATAPSVLVVATDLPCLTPDLFLALVAWPEADAVVARDTRGRQPLCAVYRRAPALAVARERLAKQQLALAGWLDALDVHELPDDVLASLDPEGNALSNLNTPEDLAATERRLSAPG